MDTPSQVIHHRLRNAAFIALTTFLITGCTAQSDSASSSDGTVRTSEDGAIDVKAPGVDVKIDPEQGKVDVNVDNEPE